MGLTRKVSAATRCESKVPSAAAISAKAARTRCKSRSSRARPRQSPVPLCSRQALAAWAGSFHLDPLASSRTAASSS
eukprot:scaffold176966_cov26-Tisochrysis_lutea.AAC.5